MKCKNCGTEFTGGIFCPECGCRVESSSRKQNGTKRVGKIFIPIVIVLLIMGISFASSNVTFGYKKKPQMGTYTLKEGKKYPYVYVSKMDGSSDDISNLIFSVRPSEKEDDYSLKEATLRSDGTYCIQGSSWNYILSFNGNGKVKVKLEKTGDSAIVNAVTKHSLKKAVGTYKHFEANDKTIEETLQEISDVLD